MKSSDCYVEVAIFFKDGTRDWVSPINDTTEEVVIEGDKLYVENPYYRYKYNVDSLVIVVANRMLNGSVIETEILYDFK